MHACGKLVSLVLTHKEEKAYKLAIVGTGGIGKTTLAQKVYNDKKLHGRFNQLAWICVSQDYSPVSLLRQLLKAMKFVPHKMNQLNSSKASLNQLLKTRVFSSCWMI